MLKFGVMQKWWWSWLSWLVLKAKPSFTSVSCVSPAKWLSPSEPWFLLCKVGMAVALWKQHHEGSDCLACILATGRPCLVNVILCSHCLFWKMGVRTILASLCCQED